MDTCFHHLRHKAGIGSSAVQVALDAVFLSTMLCDTILETWRRVTTAFTEHISILGGVFLGWFCPLPTRNVTQNLGGRRYAQARYHLLSNGVSWNFSDRQYNAAMQARFWGTNRLNNLSHFAKQC